MRRLQSEVSLKENFNQTVKHPEKIMVWGIISVHGTGRLEIVEGIMNQHKYKDVLQRRLLPQLRDWYGDRECIFMQDGAPCHKARSVMTFLQNKNIRLLEWPGNSPDLNPIEGLWNELKREVLKTPFTTKRELIEKLIDTWHRSDRIRCLAGKFIESMPRRVQAVIKMKGGHTKY